MIKKIKIAWFSILLFFLFFACNLNKEKEITQTTNQKTPLKNESVMNIKKFDIATFNLNKNESNVYTFVNKEDIEITQYMAGDFFFEKRRELGSLFLEVYGFYSNGNIKIKGVEYKSGFPSGIWSYYDEQGNIEKTEDWDASYQYKWEDMLEFCKEKKIPLHLQTTHITRNVRGKPKPEWLVSFKVGLYFTTLTIDGITGEVLKEQTAELQK